jgi:type I restriction enzyme, S subunit
MSGELPDGWAEVALSDVCSSVPQSGPSSDAPSFRYIDLGAIDNSSKCVGAASTVPVSEAPSRARQRVAAGDVLFSTVRVYLENIALVPPELDGAIASTAFAALRPGAALEPRFLYHLVTSKPFIQAVNALQRGNSPPSVQEGDVRGQRIPLPPKAEQQSIVSRIEELFSEIDEGERALERVGQLVERYRQSVLKAAVTGELTREWRGARQESVDPRPEVCVLAAHREHYLSAPRAGLDAEARNPSRERRLERYEPPEPPKAPSPGWLPAGWAWVTVAHVAECLDYARVPVSAKEREKRVGNVPYFGANGQVGFIDQHLFDEPLVLVVEDETFTGRTKPFSYLVTGKCWVNNHAHVLRPTSAINVRFLNAVLMHYPFIPLTTGTTARRKLTQKALMAAPLAVPPLAEQLAIVDLLDAQLSAIESTSAEASRARPHATALRQSILKAAFSGQLVPQDPRDEPASALLARLAAQAAAALPAPKRRGRKEPA